jgi:Ca2+:H+ antiporter
MGKRSNTTADRVRSQALAERSPSYRSNAKSATILPSNQDSNLSTVSEAGGLAEKSDGRGSPPTAARKRVANGGTSGSTGDGHVEAASGGDYFAGSEKATHNGSADATMSTEPPPAPPPHKSEDASSGDPTIESTEAKDKPPITKRMAAGSKRFVVHMKNALFHSWVNVLLVFVPIGIIVEAIGLDPGIIFGMNAIAIIPLAGLLSFATESVAARLGDTLGALLNVSFGNAVELIIFIIALVKNEIAIVQASLLGSILANLLLILGMAFLFGGLRYREQIYNSTVTQMSACLLSLSVMSLLLPVRLPTCTRLTLR